MNARASTHRPPGGRAGSRRAIALLLIAAAVGVAVWHTPASQAQVRTEATTPLQPQAIDAAGKKRPKTQGRPARDRVRNKGYRKAHEYDVTGGDTLVSTTEFDRHGNAVRKHHGEDALENTEVDTLRDVITKIKDERRNTEMDFEYSDDDTALRVITIKQSNRPSTRLIHDYDLDSRLTSIVSDVPTDSMESGSRGRSRTSIQYDGDTDNVAEIQVVGAADPSRADRVFSKVRNTYDQGRLATQEFLHNARSEGPDSLVVASTKTYRYTAAGLLEKVTTTDASDTTNLIEETHTYDGDGNELEVRCVAPMRKDDGTGTYVKVERTTMTTRTFDADGLLKTESVEELVDGVRTSFKQKRIAYEQ